MKIELPEGYKDIEIKENWFVAENDKDLIRVELPKPNKTWWIDGYYFNGKCFEVFLIDSDE